MSILVTGGTGALGYHILSAMPRDGRVLHSFSDEMPPPWHKVPDVHYHTGNLLNYKEILSVVKESHPSYVYHLASQSSVGISYKKPYETLSTNLLGTQNLLEAVRQTTPKARVMLLSSSEIYGRGGGRLAALHDEAESPDPLTPYATSKACMELLGNQFRNAHGMHVIVVRPFHFTGPHHSRRFALPSIAFRLVQICKNGAEPVIYTGNLDVARDIVDVRDVARAMIMVLNTCESGSVFNICSGKAWTFRELTDMMIGLTGMHVDLRIDPSLERQNDIPLLVGDPSKIMDLGWKPLISIEDSLTDLYNEMVQRCRLEVASF